jgi:hypothetical protein
VNGAPQFPIQIGSFDAFRRWSQFFQIPSVGDVATLRAYAVDATAARRE